MKLKILISLPIILAILILLRVEPRGAVKSSPEMVTFNNQVVRLLQQKCQACHHPDDIAPFSLVTYNEARLFAEAMQEATESREMPPWKAAESCGEFDGNRRLTDEEISILSRWVEAGKPEGNPADLPPPLQFTDDWPLGRPDVVLEPEGRFAVNLGDDIYRCFSLPTDFGGDRFLSAIDLKPGARSIVHHAIIHLDEKGESQSLDDADPQPGFDCPDDAEFTKKGAIAWWTPGGSSRFEENGTAWRLPRGARLVLKIHYHVHHGLGGKDHTQLGLYFARQPVKKELRVLPIINPRFAIPPDDPNFQLTASYPPLPPGLDAHALGVAPHMQRLGRRMEVQAAYSNGVTRCLIEVEDWDAHWQGLYSFKEPVAIPAGTQLRLTAFYNNSRSNPDNPDFPLRFVPSGEQTDDETCIAFVKYTVDAENRSLSSPEVSTAFVDEDGRLVVKGAGFSPGADILIDGERVQDTLNHKKKKKAEKQLLSSVDWKRLVAPGKQVSVSVLNTDGVRSAAIAFGR